MAYNQLAFDCGKSKKRMFAFQQLFNSLSVNSHIVKYVIIKC